MTTQKLPGTDAARHGTGDADLASKHHIVFARFIASPQSQVLWFFATVTGPLTRPLRAVLPAGMPERRVRAVALAVYLVLWIVTDRLLRAAAPATG